MVCGACRASGCTPACVEYEVCVYPAAVAHVERAIVSRAPMAGRDREQDKRGSIGQIANVAGITRE